MTVQNRLRFVLVSACRNEAVVVGMSLGKYPSWTFVRRQWQVQWATGGCVDFMSCQCKHSYKVPCIFFLPCPSQWARKKTRCLAGLTHNPGRRNMRFGLCKLSSRFTGDKLLGHGGFVEAKAKLAVLLVMGIHIASVMRRSGQVLRNQERRNRSMYCLYKFGRDMSK